MKSAAAEVREEKPRGGGKQRQAACDFYESTARW